MKFHKERAEKNIKIKRFLSLLMAGALCLSTLPVLAEDDPTEEILVMPAPMSEEKCITVNYNDSPIAFDVEPVVENERTLVPLRAIFEAFECEVHWYGDTKTIHIYSPANAYSVSAEKFSETITDDDGVFLIEE